MVPVPGGHQLPCCSSGSGAGAGAPTGQTWPTCLLRRACRLDRQSDSVPESGMVRACGESSAFRVGAGHCEPLAHGAAHPGPAAHLFFFWAALKLRGAGGRVISATIGRWRGGPASAAASPAAILPACCSLAEEIFSPIPHPIPRTPFVPHCKTCYIKWASTEGTPCA